MMGGILKFNDKMYEKYHSVYINRDSNNANLSILEYTLRFHLDDYISDIRHYIEMVQNLKE